MREMGGHRSRSSRPSGSATSSPSCCWHPTPARGLRAPRRHRPRGHVLPELPALQARGRRAPPPQGRLRALADRPRPGDRPRGPGRRARGVGARTRPRPAPRRPAARHRQAGDPPVRGRWRRVSFHHHEVVGAKLTAKRLKALRYDKDTVKAVARLVELHLRFHGYGDGQWTDSAVRRYVTDAGPLLQRLHRLTRSDSTTRNQRKAARLSRTYDELEARIERLMEAEELAKVRPELDGNEIAEVLGHQARARCSAAPTSTCSRCGSTRDRSARRPPRERLLPVVGRPARVAVRARPGALRRRRPAHVAGSPGAEAVCPDQGSAPAGFSRLPRCGRLARWPPMGSAPHVGRVAGVPSLGRAAGPRRPERRGRKP